MVLLDNKKSVIDILKRFFGVTEYNLLKVSL